MTDEAAEVLGYRFKDQGLLRTALTHASSADRRLESNERVEYLGDAILNFVVSDYLFRKYPDLLEGEMTKIKSAVVSRKVCAVISERMGLSPMLMLGKGMSNRSKLPSSVAAAVLEAVIAAIYLDGGIRPAKRFVLKHFKPYIMESAESAHQQNFKSVLQHWAQRELPEAPAYVLLDEKGPDHSKCFEVCVLINGRRFGSAWAASKKEAEQKAALLALRELDLASVDEDGKIQVCREAVGGSGKEHRKGSKVKGKGKDKDKDKGKRSKEKGSKGK